ncbi:MAG: DNA ligase-associated DEXH box helicase, partial [Luteibaculum sp.]
MALVELTDRGWFCRAGDFFIDPHRSVPKAFITHGHADHARKGNEQYFCTPLTAQILKLRLGAEFVFHPMSFNEEMRINGVRVSFHPAGHVPGSAQLRIEHKGEVWVISGDYKLEDDGLSAPFQAVKCHHFISECTFGLPVFQWRPQQRVKQEILAWYDENCLNEHCSFLNAYSLGKAQRLIHLLVEELEEIWVHPAVGQLNQVILPDSVQKKTRIVHDSIPENIAKKALVILPPQGNVKTGRVPV